jgi:aminoglycoside/choline kinase family phosphotransferase
MSVVQTIDDPRAQQARAWAQTVLRRPLATFQPASSDAGFRRYFRAEAGGRSWIVMDAPPQQENCEPFVRIAGLLRGAGLHVPQILDWDRAAGYMLLSDLGRQTYLDVLDASNADALFDQAIDALLRWQLATEPDVLPAYDEAELRRELALFPDWYLARHAGIVPDVAQRVEWDALVTQIARRALAQPQVYVHRDYMPRNLMPGTPGPGVLDFQDARRGPIAYDVMSLFRDAFISWPQPRVDVWHRRYWQRARAAGAPVPEDFEQFADDLAWIGVQRHLKVLGVFARLHYRDGKPRYLADAARFGGYLRQACGERPQLAPLQRLLQAWQLW